MHEVCFFSLLSFLFRVVFGLQERVSRSVTVTRKSILLPELGDELESAAAVGFGAVVRRHCDSGYGVSAGILEGLRSFSALKSCVPNF